MRRRQILRNAIVAAPCLSSHWRSWAVPRDPSAKLLLVFLRGGCDAANVLVPHGAPFYYEARPNIAIARPGSGSGAALAVDDTWGLTPALADSVYPLFARRQLAFVPFAGTDDASRSHFETQDHIELGLGVDSPRDYRSGFMNRLAGVLGASETSHLAALAFTDQVPLIFRGPEPVANQALREAPRGAVNTRQTELIERMYAGTRLEQSVRGGFEVRQEVSREMADEMQAASRNAIAAGGFAAQAQRIGRLMRERVQIGFVDVGGWDTHVAEGGATGTLAQRLGELGRGLALLGDELGPAWDRTVVVVLSEFGRTFRENGNRGTDHGHGGVFFVLGGAVRGGRVVGEQVSIGPGSLFQSRDLPVLNEVRATLSGLFTRMFGLDSRQLDRVFPGSRARELGLL